MAVEIPVVVDIDAAFQEAASHIPKAMKPMQEYLNSNALRIQVNLGDGKKFTIKQIFEDAKMSAADLEAALSNIEARISGIASKGGFDLTKGLTTQEANLMRVYGALDAKVNKTADGSKLIGKLYEVNIEKARRKVQQLTSEIETLTIKQNKAYKRAGDGSFIKTKQFDILSEKIKTANIDLQKTKSNLSLLSVELDKITSSGVRAASAIGAIKSPAVKMVEAWEMGAMYVERYNASLATANSRIGMLIKSSLSLMAIHAAVGFVRNIRQVTSEFEMQRVALGGIIQDTEEAERLFKRIKAAAIQSPFEIKDLVSFTKQLSAYRIETENLFDVTMKLADVSAGLGVDMSRLVLAYGQVRAAAVLRGQELRQFTEAGIPLVELLAEKFTQLNHRMVSTGEVFELISKRAVPFRMIEEIFNDMTSAGGIFYKMQEKQSETLKGQWMKLKDALSIMYDEIGNTKVVHGAMESLLKDAMGLLQNWREVGRNIKIVVAAMVAYKLAIVNARIAANALTAVEMAQVSALQLNVVGRSKLIASLFGEVAATKVQVAIGNLYVKMKQREMMATNLFTHSLYKMIAALLANPYALAVAGIAALVAAIIKFSKHAKEAVVTSDELQKSINEFNKAKSSANDINELCDAYDNLSEKSAKTKEDEEKLARVTKELAKSYPGAITGANEHTKAITLDTKVIRERNEAVKEAIRLSLLESKQGSESRLSSLQSEYDRISEILARGSVEKGAYGGTWFEPISEEDKVNFGKRLIEIESELGKYKEVINEADEALIEFNNNLIGPPPPEFLGDEWRMRISSYSTLLSDSQTTANAFTTDQIRGFGSAMDAVEEAVKEYEKLTKAVDFYSHAISVASGAQKAQLESSRDNAIALQSMYAQIITDYNAWDLLKKKTPKSSYTQDPFIKQMEERIKYMKDFKKGYDDLNKFISSSDALSKVGEQMKTRGLALGLDVTEQTRAAEDLSKWYEDMMDTVFSEVKKKYKVTGTIESFLSQQISDTTNRGKALRDFQKLLQSLFDAKTDLDVSNLKKSLEDNLKRVQDEIKRSETARNFYKDILDLSGDEELATNMAVSVYGGIGNDFKTNMQKQLNAAFNTLDGSQMTEKLVNAFKSMDFDTILKDIEKFPDEQQKVLRQLASDYEKYNADIAKDLLKSLQNAKTYGEKRVELAQQTAKRIAQINAMNIPESEKEALRSSNAKKEAEEAQKIAYESFKESPMYVELFANLDRASTKMLRNMRDNLEAMKASWKDLPATDLKEMQSRLEELDSQLATKNPFRELIDSMKEYREMRKNMSRSEADATAVGLTEYARLQKEALDIASKEYEVARDTYGLGSLEEQQAKDNLEVQKAVTDEAIEQAEAAQDVANGYRKSKKHIEDAANGLKEWAGYITKSLDGVQKIVDTFASDDVAETFGIISEGIGETLEGAGKIAAGAAMGVAGIPEIISGIGDVVAGTFGMAQKLKIKDLNKKIEEQERIVESLDKSYDHLEKAMAKAFGSDYIANYNKQLEELEAKQKAYEEQARLEGDKGKKADEDKIREYSNAAKDAQDEIDEMKGKLAEFFSGTDVTSAAKDFANAWIEAYREFGSTTDAMKEKFQELIQNMVEQSLGAKIMQSILDPLFQSIDEMAASGGELSAQEIAQIGQMAPEYIDKINDAMTNLMTQLAAAGYNVRQQVGGFTGISRDIAGASEESINGLAAGINTQNFYMSLISQNVASILAALTGSPVEGATGAGTPDVTDPYKDQMLLYAGSLPQMRDDMYAIRSMLEKVVRPNGTNATHYVAVRM